MILRLKYQFWHKNTNNYLDFQEFIEKVTKTAVFGINIITFCGGVCGGVCGGFVVGAPTHNE